MAEAPSGVESTQPVAPAARADPSTNPAKELLPRGRGQQIGRYLVLGQLGHGGMGVVYLAYDPELDRQVAMKVVAAGGPWGELSEGRRTRVLREAQAMARVSHPNVVAIHDVGEIQDGIYLAMELVDGHTLRGWLEQKKRDPLEIVQVLEEAGRGLIAAHEAGLVHRDFKPENVLISRTGRVLVSDFGIARLNDVAVAPSIDPDVPKSGPWSENVTQAGAELGTPGYIAPELYRGAIADERADQFAFCATLYWALYGERPFNTDELRQAGKSGMAPPRMRPLPQGPRVPPTVRRALERGLSVDPAARFVSMTALLSELRIAMRPSRTGRIVAAAAAMLALAAVAGAIGGSQWLGRAQRCSGGPARLSPAWSSDVRSRIQQRFAQVSPAAFASFDRTATALDVYANAWLGMHRDACEATAVRHEQSESALQLRMQCLDGRLRDLQSLTALFVDADSSIANRATDAVYGLASVRLCADATALAEVVRPPQDAQARAKVDALAADLSHVNALRLSGSYPRALELAKVGTARASELGYRPLEAQALYLRGILEDTVGHTADAVSTLGLAVNAAEMAHDDRLKVRIASWALYAASHSQGLADGHAWERLGKAALERSGTDPELEAELLANLGSLLISEGRLAQALEVVRRSVSLFNASVGPESSKTLVTMANLSYVELQLGDVARAIEHLQTAIQGIERVRGPDHPLLAGPLTNLALSQAELGQFDPAMLAANRALAIAEARFGPQHLTTTTALDARATVLRTEGRFAESLAVFQASLDRKRSLYAEDDPELWYSHDGIGESLLGLGRTAEATEHLRRALMLKVSEPLLRAATRFALAKALWPKGRKESIRLCDEARAEFNEGGRPDKALAVADWLSAHAP